MTSQFSLAHLTVLGCAPHEVIYIAAQAGYDYISLRPIYMGLPNEPNYALAENREMFRQTRQAITDTGIKLLDIELARIYDGVDVKRYLPAMEVAAELGGRHIISSIWTPDRSFYMEKFAELCELAKSFGLTVDLEFMLFAEVKDLQESLAVIRSANQDNCGILIDTLHFNRSLVPLEELDDVPRELFHFAHLCDGPAEIPTTREDLIHTARAARLYPGEGGIDLAGILHRIPEVPYSIELPNLERVKELGYAGHALRCLQTAREYLSSQPRLDK